jgi:hypothetical protein
LINLNKDLLIGLEWHSTHEREFGTPSASGDEFLVSVLLEVEEVAHRGVRFTDHGER